MRKLNIKKLGRVEEKEEKTERVLKDLKEGVDSVWSNLKLMLQPGRYK